MCNGNYFQGASQSYQPKVYKSIIVFNFNFYRNARGTMDRFMQTAGVGCLTLSTTGMNDKAVDGHKLLMISQYTH